MHISNPVCSILAAHAQSKRRLKRLEIKIPQVPAVEFGAQEIVASLGFAPQKTKVYTALGFALPNLQQLQCLKLEGKLTPSEDEIDMFMRGLKAWPRQHYLSLDGASIDLPDTFKVPKRGSKSQDAKIATFMAQVGSWPKQDCEEYRMVYMSDGRTSKTLKSVNSLAMSKHYKMLSLPAEVFGSGNVGVQQLLRCVDDKHARGMPCVVLRLSCIGLGGQLTLVRCMPSAASMC